MERWRGYKTWRGKEIGHILNSITNTYDKSMSHVSCNNEDVPSYVKQYEDLPHKLSSRKTYESTCLKQVIEKKLPYA